MPVGCDGDIEWISGWSAPGGELADHFQQVFAQERLSAGEAHFFDTQVNEIADQAEVFGGRELGVLRTYLAGAAVDALVVAAVGDGDAQVCDEAAVAVQKAFWERFGLAGRRFDELRNNRHVL